MLSFGLSEIAPAPVAIKIPIKFTGILNPTSSRVAAQNFCHKFSKSLTKTFRK